MSQIFELEVFKLFVLVMIRFSGLIVTAPVLGSRNMPVMAKAGLAALCAILMTPLIPALPNPLPDELIPLGVMAIGEAAIGVSMGFVMTLAFAAIQVAGEIIDMLSGFAMVNVFNPAMQTQTPVFGFIFFLLTVLYLLVLDGHHQMLRHMAETFDKIPVGTFMLKPGMGSQIAAWGSVMFIDGLMIAAPLGGALFLTYVTMGIMGRLVPQIHLFVVGLPLTVGMALFMTAFFVEMYLIVMDGMFGRMWGHVTAVVRLMMADAP